MGFVLSKVLMMLMLPPASIILLLLSGLAAGRKHPRCGRFFIFAAFIALSLLSLPLLADLLIKPLESADPPFCGDPGKASAVVVLGGGVKDLSWVPAATELGDASLSRIVSGIELARKFRLPLVVSGGSGAINGSTLEEADAMAVQAARLGMPAKDIIIENTSRNTWENAVQVRRLLGARSIILVTSAFHMKRATGMFRKQGFTVLPAPTGYLSQTRPPSWTNLIPRARYLDISSVAISEYLSLSWYGLTGKF